MICPICKITLPEEMLVEHLTWQHPECEELLLYVSSLSIEEIKRYNSNIFKTMTKK